MNVGGQQTLNCWTKKIEKFLQNHKQNLHLSIQRYGNIKRVHANVVAFNYFI